MEHRALKARSQEPEFRIQKEGMKVRFHSTTGY